MPRAGLLFANGGLVDYYEISVKQFQQQILPAGMPQTTVWGYGPEKTLSPWAPKIWNAPSLTIEANYNVPVRIKWINKLHDADGNYLPHLLPVDPTLHWANPAGGEMGRDMRPTFTATPGRYTGPVPMVTHVHGAAGVGDESDGYAEAWYLPAAANIPAGYAKEGTWYNFFKSKARAKFGTTWGPGFATFQYPKGNRASTKWYHDHALGMTRLNVYAGPAGFYNVRGGPAGDFQVRDSRTGRVAALPGPAPSALDQVLPDRPYYEVPIAIQDRSFNTDGSLFYPDTRAFFDGIAGPYIPDHRRVADVESRVLRQHDHGQRQHLAVPECRTATLSLPLPEWLPGQVPDPRFLCDDQHPGLADRQRRRLPGRARESECGEWEPASHEPRRTRRRDRRLHRCGERQLCARQCRSG